MGVKSDQLKMASSLLSGHDALSLSLSLSLSCFLISWSYVRVIQFIIPYSAETLKSIGFIGLYHDVDAGWVGIVG